MIHLRPDQLAAFQARYDTGLLDRIVQHVTVEHADVVGGFPEPLVREMVANGLARARRYGLTWESSLTAFVALMFTVAPNFDEQPAIHRVLMNDRLPPDERFELLQRIRDRHWRDAQHRYDERAWFPELYDDDPEDRGPVVRIRRIQR
jgi:hypothetical protein